MSDDTSRESDPVSDPAESCSCDPGILVMAHGSDPERRREVLECVEPLAGRHLVEVAFGIAYPDTTQAAIDALEARGARRIAVIRLLVSGSSYRARTETVLGRRGGEGGSRFHPVRFRVPFALCVAGLGDDPRMGEVLASRARDLSESPSSEDVLVLAHGSGDDEENERWRVALEKLADAVRDTRPFRRVRAETLREDWPEKRVDAEQRIRSFIERASEERGTAIVIPFRIHGFGPYQNVLEGLDYIADGRGLIPHPHVTTWIEDQIEAMRSVVYAEPSGPASRGEASP